MLHLAYLESIAGVQPLSQTARTIFSTEMEGLLHAWKSSVESHHVISKIVPHKNSNPVRMCIHLRRDLHTLF